MEHQKQTVNFHCGLCITDFKNNYNLRRHAKKFHPDQLDVIAPLEEFTTFAKCDECNQIFSRPAFLKRHIINVHPDKMNDVVVKKTYKCMECHKQFTYIKHLKSHQKSHGFTITNPDSTFTCCLCQCSEASRANLTNHFEKIHDVKIECQNFEFSTMAEFETWKLEMEHKDRSSFVKWQVSCVSQHTIVSKYICHRSGTYNRTGSHLRVEGSNKINGFCPAGIKVVCTEGKCKVTFTKTHIGHTNDLEHLTLSGIPSGSERHLLTKKDVVNIEKSLNLNAESIHHKNDAVSVEAWVEKMKNHKCILFYKPQDIICKENSKLKKEDFVLVIMTHGQMEMMQKYSQDCICLDWTDGLNAYGFKLNTLMILDDLQEAFPCAFLISNRTDEEVIKLFLSCIRDRLQMQLRPKVFMSDMAKLYYNAWIRIMFPAEFRLFCTWHMKQAWKKDLTKINCKEKQIAVNDKLQTLLEETDVGTFSAMMHNFVQSLSEDPQTLNFANYFTQHYMNNTKAWAYCHRLPSGLNTDMHLERMHRTIKYLYLKGRNVNRLDKAIQAILKFVRDKLFDRAISCSNGELYTKIKDIRNHHKTADVLHLDSVLEMETGWQVSSQSSNEIYIVEERRAECDCNLLCTQCEACIHRYSCTCLDSSVKWNMCEHIHLVCRYRKSFSLESEDYEVKSEPSEAEGDLDNDFENSDLEEEVVALVKSENSEEEVAAQIKSENSDLEEEVVTLVKSGNSDLEEEVAAQIKSENSDLEEEVAALVKSENTDLEVEVEPMHDDWQQQILQQQQDILKGFKEALFAIKSMEELDVFKRILAPLEPSLAAVKNRQN